jgi:hypothetical protein
MPRGWEASRPEEQCLEAFHPLGFEVDQLNVTF